jgi:hypothetical protein
VILSWPSSAMESQASRHLWRSCDLIAGRGGIARATEVRFALCFMRAKPRRAVRRRHAIR